MTIAACTPATGSTPDILRTTKRSGSSRACRVSVTDIGASVMRRYASSPFSVAFTTLACRFATGSSTRACCAAATPPFAERGAPAAASRRHSSPHGHPGRAFAHDRKEDSHLRSQRAEPKPSNEPAPLPLGAEFAAASWPSVVPGQAPDELRGGLLGPRRGLAPSHEPRREALEGPKVEVEFKLDLSVSTGKTAWRAPARRRCEAARVRDGGRENESGPRVQGGGVRCVAIWPHPFCAL